MRSIVTDAILLRADTTSLAIVAAVVAVGAILFFVLKGKGKEKSVSQLPESDAAADEATPAVVREEAVEAPVAEESTLEAGLSRTRQQGFIAKLSRLFSGGEVASDVMDQVEEVLFTADIGVRTAERLMNAIREQLDGEALTDAAKIWSALRAEAIGVLEEAGRAQAAPEHEPGTPFVTMVLGVNGAGKTTSIGKLGNQLADQGESVVFIAGDTFRAAAAEQLEIWGDRVGAEVIKGKEGADPASVVFDGLKAAKEASATHVFVDTAGRLHTHTNLMAELAKVRRVMGKAIPGAPHEVLMVLDGTTGQNAIQQAKMFHEVTDVTGVILTKLDGTAKGGVVIGVCDELKIPIRNIGIGEKVADLRPFIAEEFVDALFGTRAP